MEMFSYRRALALFFYLIAMTYLLQWNLRGFNANYSDLHMLTATKTPAIIALQETKLKAETPCNLHHYKSYRYDHPTVTTAHGGTAPSGSLQRSLVFILAADGSPSWLPQQ